MSKWVVVQNQWSFDHMDIVGTRCFGPFDDRDDALRAAMTNTEHPEWYRPGTVHELMPDGAAGTTEGERGG